MADPKRRQSKTRSRKRRTHYKIAKLHLVTCGNCSAKIRPHRVCPMCGYYKGKPVVIKKVKTKDKKAA